MADDQWSWPALLLLMVVGTILLWFLGLAVYAVIPEWLVPPDPR
jgi:hypothetical protein